MAYNEIKQHGTEDFPFELYHIDKMHPKYEMAYHWHTQIEIIRVISGRLEIKLNDRTYTAEEKDTVIVNSEVIHSAVPHDCVYECIVFDPEFFSINTELESFISNLLNHNIFIKEYFPHGNSEFHAIIESLFESMEKCGAGYRYTTAGLILCLFGETQKNGYLDEKLYTETENAKNIYKLKKVLKFIRKSYSKPITLEDMSEAAGISPKYFCSFFKKMTSETPVEYLNNYRIERASHKLLGSDETVTDIAYNCGFNDLSYFIKVFKEKKGISPKKFRMAVFKK